MILKLAAVAALGILLGSSVRVPAVLACTAIAAAATGIAVVLGKADTAIAGDFFFGIVVFQGFYLIGLLIGEIARSLRNR